MIALFPTPFEDELAYSLFARYYERSGYINYRSVAEDLFVNPNVKPNIEFCNLLTNDIQRWIGSMEEFVDKHTMLPYYLFPLPPERQCKALKKAYAMNVKELVNTLIIPRSRTTKYLRFCPLCVENDRNTIGYTYWRRSHQMYGINVCHLHGCRLLDSDVPIVSTSSPSVITAESSVDRCDSTISKALPTEVAIAKYSYEIMNVKIDSKTSLSKFLNGILLDTRYTSIRGAKRYIKELTADFKEFYKGVSLYGFEEDWQVEKVLCGDRMNPYEVCLLGMFLDISPQELVSRHKQAPKKNVQKFDDLIIRLKAKGYNYREISGKLGIAYDYSKVLAKRNMRKL